MNKTTTAQQHLCETGFLERPRYFARQLLTPAEMTLEQTYFRDKLRRHNRFLHGWGVVCGALVCVIPRQDGDGVEPWQVRVSPGYILGPYGDEIVIDTPRVLDLRSPGTAGATGASPAEHLDPWCSPVFVERKEGPLYVAVKYKEMMCRPIRVQPNGCGCDETQCEYSRLRDGYELGVLDACPGDHADPPNMDEIFKGGPPACEPCPPDPWVVLAEVQVDADGSIISVDNCSCRRIVMSLASVWRECDAGLVVIDTVDPNEVRQGQKDAEVIIRGKNIDPQAEVKLGPGLKVTGRNAPTTDRTSLVIKLDVEEDAEIRPRTLLLSNPDCVAGVKRDALKILPKLTRSLQDSTPTAAPTERPQATPAPSKRRARGNEEKGGTE